MSLLFFYRYVTPATFTKALLPVISCKGKKNFRDCKEMGRKKIMPDFNLPTSLIRRWAQCLCAL